MAEKSNFKHKIPQRGNFVESFVNMICKPLAKSLSKTPLTPNQVTWFSGIIGSIGGCLILVDFSNNYIISAILIFLYVILDGTDGDIARIKNMQSLFGKWFDSIFDLVNKIIILTTMGITLVLEYGSTPFSLFLVITLSSVLMTNQLLVLYNDHILSLHSKSSVIGSQDLKEEKEIKIVNKSFVRKITEFYILHFSLGHITFLMYSVIILVLLDIYNDFIILYLGYIIMTAMSLILLLYNILYPIYKFNSLR